MKRGICLLLLVLLFGLDSRAEKQKDCFVCKGTGQERCAACVAGKIDCPAPCLKPHVGVWEHMEVKGHSPKELWQKFYYTKNGKPSWEAWTQAHLGEIIESREGAKPVNKGKCRVCAGSMKVNCGKCKGSGTTTCQMCQGKKSIPESWSATNNPKFNATQSFIKLKDGRTIRGKIVMTIGNTVVIKPSEGKNIEVTKDDIVVSEKK